jgi:hypothetical protein
VQGFSHNRRMAQDLTEFLNSTDTDLNSKYFYWVEVEEK